MRFRLIAAFWLLALVAVVASALVTLHLGARGAEAEANRRLSTAASYGMVVITSERDRNRSDALEVASRVTIIQALATNDQALAQRQVSGLRQTIRDDLLALYRADGSLLASDALADLKVDEPIGLVRAALEGTTSAATVTLGPNLLLAAAAPVLDGNGHLLGAVLAADLLDDRYVQRLTTITNLAVALESENGLIAASEPVSGRLLTADQWVVLRGRGDTWFRTDTTAQPLRALARPLRGADNRALAGLIFAIPESTLTPIEPNDIPLYLVLTGVMLIGLWGIGLVAAWGLSGRGPMTAGRAPRATVAEAMPALMPRTDEVRTLPGLTIDLGRRQVEIDGRPVTLTPTEFDLLWALSNEPGRVMTREALLEHLRGADWRSEPGLLDTHVSNLRRKIEPDPSRPRFVQTVRGVGFRLAEPAALDL